MAAAAIWAATACGGAQAAQPAIERLIVIEVDLQTTSITDEAGRARLLAALPAGDARDRLAAVDLTDRLLVVLSFDACSMTNPRLRWRGSDHLSSELDDTGIRCAVPIPAIGVFALERAGLPDLVTLGGEQRRDSDRVVWQRS